MSPTVVLASTSPYRRALLERLGLSFTAQAPACDEEALKDPSLSPQALAEMLADAKAASVAEGLPDAIVIGSDQVATIDGQILGKPGTEAKAVEQLALLAGREHQLITAMVVRCGASIQSHTDVTTLRMRALDRDALARYVARDQPIDCAGAYKLEAAGVSLFEQIASDDHTAITGLPLIATVRLLSGFGVVVP